MEKVQSHKLSELDNLEDGTVSTAQSRWGLCGYWAKTWNYRAIIAVLLSCVCFAFQSVFVKMLSNKVPAGDIVFARFAIQGFASVVAMVFFNETFLANSKLELLFLLARGTIGAVSITCEYYAAQHVSASIVTSILFGAPAFVAIFARIFLKEPLFVFDAVVIAGNIAGLILIAQPPFLFWKETVSEEKGKELLGVLLSCIAMFLTSLVYICIRKLCLLNVGNVKVVFYFAAVGTIVSGSTNFALKEWAIPPCGYVRILLILIGFLNWTAQVALTYAFTYSDAVVVSVLSSIRVPMTIVFELLIIGHLPDLVTGIGMIVLFLFSVGVVLREKCVCNKEKEDFSDCDVNHIRNTFT